MISYLGKAGETDMNALNDRVTDKPDGGYWEKLAGKLHIIKYAVIVSLALFVLLTAFFGRDELKAGNFRYFFKFFQINPFLSSAAYEDISYTGNPDMSFALYKGDLAVLCDGRLTLYNMAGRQILSVDTDGADAVDGSGKYLAAYRRGSGKVTLYNSFSEVYNFESAYPVTDVCVGSDGGFAAVTSEKNIRSSVLVYNKAFSLVYTWKSADKYVSCAALSDDGKRLAIFASGTSEDIQYSELIVKKTGSDETVCDVKFEGEQPYGIFFSDDGSLIAVTDRAARFYSGKGTQISEYVFDGKLVLMNFTDGTLTIAERRSGTSGVKTVSLDRDGDRLAGFDAGIEACGIASGDGNIYLLGYGTLIVGESDGTVRQEEIDGGANRMFVLDDGSILICYTSGTKLVAAESGD